ncbi:hypothetical protein KCU92_g572, partial [Aureobasidium melanogenum]
MAIEVVRVLVVIVLEGKDSNHISLSAVPKDRDWLLVGHAYHALHNMCPEQFTSSFFRLFDWIMGTSSFKNKRIAMTGTRGAFGAALEKQLESDGVSGIAALRYGVDFNDESVSTDGMRKLADTDILILAHGLRYGDVMKANYETSRRLVEVFAHARKPCPGRRPLELPEVWYTGSEAELHSSWGNQLLYAYSASKRRFLPFAKSLYESETVSQARTPSRPNTTSKDIAIRCRIYSHRRFAHVRDHTLAIAIAIAIAVTLAVAIALAICLPIYPFYTASRRPVAPQTNVIAVPGAKIETSRAQ